MRKELEMEADAGRTISSPEERLMALDRAVQIAQLGLDMARACDEPEATITMMERALWALQDVYAEQKTKVPRALQ